MRGDACSSACGWCGACTPRYNGADGYDEYRHMDECPHPLSHRRPVLGLVEDDSCRLCGAMSWSIKRQAERRKLGVQV